jgi:hypothetical protein
LASFGVFGGQIFGCGGAALGDPWFTSIVDHKAGVSTI